MYLKINEIKRTYIQKRTSKKKKNKIRIAMAKDNHTNDKISCVNRQTL